MTNFKKTLLVGTALVAVGGFAVSAQAANISAAIEAGTATTIDGADTFTIDATNDGEGQATAITFNGAGANSLTVDSDGLDATDTADAGELGAISVTDGGGTNTLTLNEATNGDDLWLTVTGDIDGDVATDANDLNIVVDSLNTGNADDNETVLIVEGNVDLGTGTITLTGDASDEATLAVKGAADQTITGEVVSTTDNEGSVVVVINGTNTATFASAVGDVAGDAVAELTVGDDATAGGQAVFSAGVNANDILVQGTTAASSADFNGEVVADHSIAITGHANGAAAVSFAGDVTGAMALTKATNDATATYDGTAAQSISGAITANSDGDGALVVSNTGGTVTFGDAIGVVGANAVGSLSLASGSTIDISNDVSVDTLTGAGTINVSGNATIETATDLGASGTPVTFSVDAGQVLTVDTEAAGVVYANTALDGAASGLTFGASSDTTYTGNITATTAGEGALVVSDGAVTTAIVGDIGASGSTVDSLAIEGNGNDNVVTTTGDLYVDAITIDNNDELHFIGTSAQAVSGTIGGADDANDSAVIVGDGTDASNVTFNGVIGGAALDTFDVLTKSKATLAADATTVTDFTIDGTLRVNQGVTATSAAFAAGAADGTIELVVGNTAAGADESATLASGNALDLDNLDGTTANSASLKLVKGTGVISNGDEFTIGDGTGAVLNMVDDTGESVTDDFALFNFTLYTGDSTGVTAGDDSDIVAVASAVSTSTITTTANNAKAADAVLTITDAQYDADADLAAVYDNVAGATADQIDERVEAVQPTVDAGNVVAATVVNNQSMNITQTRLAALRGGSTGMAAGNVGQGLGVWGQVFGQTGEQDRRDGIDGYDVDTWGLAAGMDTQNMGDNLTMGLAFSYAGTDVESKNANTTDTEIDTYQIAVYGAYELDERTWLTGQAAYANSENDTVRHNVGGVNGLNASGDFDADTWSLRAELGRDYNMESGMVLTPSFLANYMYYDGDDYTETGAGGANLVVDQDEVSLFELGVGVDASWLYQQADGSYLEPELRAGYRYDLIGDEYETTSRFTGGGASFKTEGFDPAQSTFNVGGSLTYYAVNNWEFTANYDFEVKSDYDAHSGYLRAAYKF